MTANDYNQRLTTLEAKIDLVDSSINELSNTIAEAMKLFSHSESSQQIESTERRFQSNLKNTEGIQSRYRGASYPVAGIEI